MKYVRNWSRLKKRLTSRSIKYYLEDVGQKHLRYLNLWQKRKKTAAVPQHYTTEVRLILCRNENSQQRHDNYIRRTANRTVGKVPVPSHRDSIVNWRIPVMSQLPSPRVRQSSMNGQSLRGSRAYDGLKELNLPESHKYFDSKKEIKQYIPVKSRRQIATASKCRVPTNIYSDKAPVKGRR